jgi:hypothetical protein
MTKPTIKVTADEQARRVLFVARLLDCGLSRSEIKDILAGRFVLSGRDCTGLMNAARALLLQAMRDTETAATIRVGAARHYLRITRDPKARPREQTNAWIRLLDLLGLEQATRFAQGAPAANGVAGPGSAAPCGPPASPGSAR